MKRMMLFLLSLILSFSLAACSGVTNRDGVVTPSDNDSMTNTGGDNSVNSILVVYFSATGTTKQLAEYAADILNSDINGITAADPYTEEDLKYY